MREPWWIGVIKAAIKSSPEWAASERMPRLPVVTPTKILSPVTAIAAKTELAATVRFSARMASEPKPGPDMAEEPHILALSLWWRLPPSGRVRVATALCARILC